MGRQLGMLTCYGIEYVYDFLGKERIDQKIAELKDKPTMGMKLEDVVYKEPKFGYISGKGILWVFTILLDSYFENDIDLTIFLYQNSKRYNEYNYFESGLLKAKRIEDLQSIDRMIIRNPQQRNYYEELKCNSYWMDYHFLYQHLISSIKKHITEQRLEKMDIVGSYELDKNKLTGTVDLEIKTRRKPLTGKYLLFRQENIWYNLEPIKYDELDEVYKFTKDNRHYLLSLNRRNFEATINLVGQDLNRANDKINVANFDLDSIMREMMNDYVSNFKSISERTRKNLKAFDSKPMGNSCVVCIADHYYEIGELEKFNEVCKLNNSYSDVWVQIDTYEE